MGSAMVFTGIRGEFDTIALASMGCIEIFATNIPDFQWRIVREPLDMKMVVFVPGEKYSRFGSDMKKSSGFVWWDGEPLMFVGTYTDTEGQMHALFQTDEGPMNELGYENCYWSWKAMPEHNIFVCVTHACAGRVMEFVPKNKRGVSR